MHDISTAKTVFEILGIEPGNVPPPPYRHVDPPRREGTPLLPPPGIYFDMPMHIYHMLPALSNSGVKLLAASPMIFWGKSWMNPKITPREAKHFIAGEAYHCRVMEGADVFAARYAAEYVADPTRKDIISTVEEVKHAISQQTIRVGETDASHTPVVNVMEDDGNGGFRKRKAKREDWVKQLLEIYPDAPLAENLKAQYEAQHPGKIFLWGDLIDNIELAARMIEGDPGIAPYFRGGHPEVTLIWYCPVTGVPMKCRVDYMKVRRMVDLKTFENQRLRAPETAIRFEISSYKYNIQPSVYIEGGAEVRKLVRSQGDDAIFVCGEPSPEREAECRAFAKKWAKHVESDLWTWVFQMKGDAPITRAVDYPTGGTTYMVTNDIVSLAKKRFAEYAPIFGTDPWLDIAPTYTIPDEEIPQAATEM